MAEVGKPVKFSSVICSSGSTENSRYEASADNETEDDFLKV